MFSRWLINLEGERHLRLRRRFATLFTPRRAPAFRETIVRTADVLLDPLLAAGEMDLVADFARPLPFTVIADVLGVPRHQRRWLSERMVTIGRAFANQHDPSFVARADTAVAEAAEYFAALLHERSDTPRDDLLSVLVRELPADRDGRADTIANCIFFVIAGHETTTSLIAGGTLLLLEHPDELARLRDDPAQVPAAVEEVLRLIAPVSLVVCRSNEDVEIDGCCRIPAGTRRHVFLAAANRDPAVFPYPDLFDPRRTPNPHLSFSAGAHFCLGAPLARLHGEVALNTILRRLPELHLAGAPVWRGSVPLRELEHLAVAWQPAARP
jgi:cytochrome P450